jgi:NADH-quinone oxidoreductase subunit K
MLGLLFFFNISIVIFFLGLIGIIIAKKNNFLLLISLEILFIAINLLLIVNGFYLDDFEGIIFTIFILAVSGAEISIGLALFILVYKRFKSFSVYHMINIKG